MKKKTVIIVSSIIILLLIIISIIVIKNTSKNNENNESSNYDQYYIYDKEKVIVDEIENYGEVQETIKDITVLGIAELNHNGYIYAFNGQHFGEFGFEMEEYTSINIENKSQKCVNYITSKEYDTTYIEEGDVLICTGDLTKRYMTDANLDTKEFPITVLKAEDYNKMKREALNNERECVITIGEYFDNYGEIYFKYSISDKTYRLPFALKLNITEDTEIIGNLENGKRVKVKYKDLNVPLERLELKSIEIIEDNL